MKKKLPPSLPSGNELPDSFFETQMEEILRKTVVLESWKLPDTTSIESCFPVPGGFWMQLEDGIREKVRPQPKTTIRGSSALAWVVPIASVLLVLGIGYNLFFQTDTVNENWTAQLEKLSQEELIASIEIQDREIRELTESMAAGILEENDLPYPASQVNPSELEQALDFEELDLEDLPANLDSI